MKVPSPSAGVGGYQCTRCGSFVPYGIGHQCWGPSMPQPPQATAVDHGFRYVAALERIAAALEEIAKAGVPLPEEAEPNG